MSFDRTEKKTCYRYDENGKFIAPYDLNWSDRDPNSGTWILPAFATFVVPHENLTDKEYQVFDGTQWNIVEIPDPPVTPPYVPPEPKPDPMTVAIMTAIIDFEDRITKLEGGVK